MIYVTILKWNRRLSSAIRHLSFQDRMISEYKDTLTGLYDLNGMKRAYSSVNHTEDRSLYLIMLRINLFPHRLNETEIHIKTNASAVCEEAYKCGHCPVMWSTPCGHYDRDTCKMADCRS